jgi:TonB family protein
LIPVTGASGDRHTPSGAKPISGATPEEESSAARASILAASAIGVTSPATVISKVMPEYPRQARATHIGGNVVVIVEVDDQGKVVKATAVSGPKVLRTAAEAALLKWRFKPAVQNGINVSSRVSIGVLFQ